MRFVLLILLVIAVLLLLRRALGRGKSVPHRPSEAVSERMEACAHCGVIQPVSECILSKGRYYCGNSHRQEAEARGD